MPLEEEREASENTEARGREEAQAAGVDIEEDTLEEWCRPRRKCLERMFCSLCQSQGLMVDPVSSLSPHLVFVKRGSNKELTKYPVCGRAHDFSRVIFLKELTNSTAVSGKQETKVEGRSM